MYIPGIHMVRFEAINHLKQWFSNFLQQVAPQKIFGISSTTIMTNIKMQFHYAQ